MTGDLMIEKIMYISHNKDSFRVNYIFGKCYENICPYYSLLKQLGDNFLRINDSVIVNFDYVANYTNEKISTINGDTFQVSSKFQKSVSNRYFKIKLEKFNTDE